MLTVAPLAKAVLAELGVPEPDTKRSAIERLNLTGPALAPAEEMA